MRRTLATLVAALLVGSAVPATAQPGAGASGGQEAFGWWVEMKGDTGRTWMVDAMRLVTDSGPATLGFIGRGRCTKSRADGWVIVSCSLNGPVRELGLDEFQMDPALRTAAMNVKIGRFRHRMDWTARGAPGLGQSVYGGEFGVFGGATAGTDSSANGSLFGKKVSKNCVMCYLAEGAGAAVWAGAAEREIDIHGDRFVAQLTYRRRI
jgi:hypothetical protein